MPALFLHSDSRSDLPTVATLFDSRALVLPVCESNRRVGSLRNIIETGKIGMLYLCPGIGESLRATFFRGESLFEATASKARNPLLGIGVEIEECLFSVPKHCSVPALSAWGRRIRIRKRACTV